MDRCDTQVVGPDNVRTPLPLPMGVVQLRDEPRESKESLPRCTSQHSYSYVLFDLLSIYKVTFDIVRFKVEFSSVI